MNVETPSQRVYHNSLIFSNICTYVPSKSDLITCLILGKAGFECAAKALYREVGEDVLTGVLAKRCALNRLETYAMAVHAICLASAIFPAEIDVSSYKGVYNNLSKIKFCLPLDVRLIQPYVTHPAISTINLYHSSRPEQADLEKKNGEQQRPREQLLGELQLVLHCKPEWRGATLLDERFSINGTARRFKLVSLSVGPPLTYDAPLPPSSWRDFEGLVNTAEPKEMEAVFQDLEELESNLHLGPGQAGMAVCGVPRIKRLTFVMNSTLCPESAPSTTVSQHCRANAKQLEHLTLLFETRPFYNLEKLKAFGASLRSTVGWVRFDSQNVLLGNSHLSVPLRYYNSVEGKNRVERITVCVQEQACDFSALQVACYMLRVWPASLEVIIEPFFFNPSHRLVQWMKDVEQIRQQLRRLLLGENKPGFRRVRGRSGTSTRTNG